MTDLAPWRYRPEAISARVASADDHHVPALGADELVVRDHVAFAPSILEGQYSIAKWMPCNSRPGTDRSRG